MEGTRAPAMMSQLQINLSGDEKQEIGLRIRASKAAVAIRA